VGREYVIVTRNTLTMDMPMLPPLDKMIAASVAAAKVLESHFPGDAVTQTRIAAALLASRMLAELNDGMRGTLTHDQADILMEAFGTRIDDAIISCGRYTDQYLREAN
jgi:hypothetical protein